MGVLGLPLHRPGTPPVVLTPAAVAAPALASQVRPALVLPERETRDLLDAAARADVLRGGVFSAGPTGIQQWSAPFDGPDGSPGSAVHLGSVDWCYDTPVRYYVTIFRAMVTTNGIGAGATTDSVLHAVLGLAGIPLQRERVQLAVPPARDPFAAGRMRA